MSKIDLTKEYKTRAGCEARLHTIMTDGQIAGSVHDGRGGYALCLWDAYGHDPRRMKGPNPNDLIEVKPVRKIDGWMNMYEGSPMLTKKEADKCAGPNRIACVHIVQEYEEGEGL